MTYKQLWSGPTINSFAADVREVKILRRYTRKTIRQSWAEDTMDSARRALETDEIGYKAPKQFGIPKSTLKLRHKGRNIRSFLRDMNEKNCKICVRTQIFAFPRKLISFERKYFRSHANICVRTKISAFGLKTFVFTAVNASCHHGYPKGRHYQRLLWDGAEILRYCSCLGNISRHNNQWKTCQAYPEEYGTLSPEEL